ncbi:phage tail tape measure protein [Roseiconus lacunae]|uniref:phage tail tape measure protein n=1 Tax=Roseiconus lacunae TaxID=2605694 RepID=UPI003087DDD8|nr:phage tail tape measure protein [Stieleria sp. HD01]
MNRRGIKAGDAYVEVSIRDRLAQGIRGLQSRMNRFAGSVGRLGGILTASSLASAGVFGALSTTFAATGDEIDKMSARTGVAVQTLSGLGFAAEQSGANLSAVERSMFGLSRSMLDLSRGSGEAVDAYGRLGITFRDVDGLSPEEQLFKVADGLAAVEDTSLRGALAQKIFGRAGREMLPLLALGAEGIRELIEEADSLGRVLSEDDTKAAAELTDAMNRVQSVVKSVSITIGGALAPAFTDFANTVSNSSKFLTEYVRENESVVRGVFGVIAAVGIAGGGLLAFAAATKVASISLGAFGGAMAIVSFVTGATSTLLGILEAIVLSVSGAMAFATGTTAGLATGMALLTAAETANATVASLLVGVYTALSGVAAVLAGEVALGTVAMGVFGAVAAAAGTAASIAFAPVTLIIFGVTAALGVLVGVMALAAVKAFNFAGTFETIKGTLGGVANTFSQVFDTIQAAIGSGDTEQLSRALWASVRLIWYRGIQGAVSLSKTAFVGFLGFIKRFFGELVSISLDSVGVLVDLFIRPWKVLDRIQGIVGKISNIGGSFDISANVDGAEAELQAIRESLAEDKKRTGEAEKRKGIIDQLTGLAVPGGDDGASDAEAESRRREDLMKSRLKQLEQERIAITQGKDAAEDAAIKSLDLEQQQIELLLRKTHLLRELKKQQEETQKRQDQRVEAVFDRAGKLADEGAGPTEVFARITGQIQKDLAAGVIDEDDATKATDRARRERDQAADQLRREADAIAEAMKSAQEKLQDEVDRIRFLEREGALDAETADRAEKAAKDEFADKQEQIRIAKEQEEERIKQESQRPERARSNFKAPELSTTSGFAVGAQSLNAFGSVQERQLEKLSAIATNTKLLTKKRSGYAE